MHNIIDVMGREVVNGDLVVPLGVLHVDGPALAVNDMLYAVTEYTDRQGKPSTYIRQVDTSYAKTRVYKIDRTLCTKGTPERRTLTVTLRALHQRPSLPLSRRTYEATAKRQKMIPGHMYLSGSASRQESYLYLGHCGFMDTTLTTKTGHIVIDLPVFTPRCMLAYNSAPPVPADFAMALARNMALTKNRLSIDTWANVKVLVNVPTRVVTDLGPVNLPADNLELWRTTDGKQELLGVVKHKVSR